MHDNFSSTQITRKVVLHSADGVVAAQHRKAGAAVLAALAGRFPHAQARRGIYPFAYACPSGVLRDGRGNQGCTEIMSPWGDAALAEHQASPIQPS